MNSNCREMLALRQMKRSPRCTTRAALVAGGFEDVLAAAAQNAMKPRRRNQVVVRMLAAEAQNADQPREQAVGAFREIGVARIGAADMGAVGTGGAVRIVVKGELIALDVLGIRAHAGNRIAAERHDRVARSPRARFGVPSGTAVPSLGMIGMSERHAPDRGGGNLSGSSRSRAACSLTNRQKAGTSCERSRRTRYVPLRPRSFLAGASSAGGRIPCGIVTRIEEWTVGVFSVLVGVAQEHFSKRRQIGVGGRVVDFVADFFRSQSSTGWLIPSLKPNGSMSPMSFVGKRGQRRKRGLPAARSFNSFSHSSSRSGVTA